MASAWTGSGPVSTPPRGLAYGAGAALVLSAFVGLGLGVKAAWRESSAPQLGAAADSVDSADTLVAKPIVELPAITAPANNTAEADASESAAAENRSEAIQEKTAEAQQVQATTSRSGRDIDTILASPTEKPTAPSKSATVEPAPPGPPVKSDVPF